MFLTTSGTHNFEHGSLTLVSNLHLYLQVSCHFMCLVSFVFDIRLNTLTFMFLILSGTHNFEYGSLILLQLPLNLFTSIL